MVVGKEGGVGVTACEKVPFWLCRRNVLGRIVAAKCCRSYLPACANLYPGVKIKNVREGQLPYPSNQFVILKTEQCLLPCLLVNFGGEIHQRFILKLSL